MRFEVVRGQFVAVPDDLIVVAGESYGARGSLRKLEGYVVHETVTRSAKVADGVLRKRKLSVHLVTDENAQTIQHEPLLVECAHAGRPRNATTIGDEVTNPYYPKHLKKGLVWSEVIAAPWAHGDAYVLPTPAQAEAVARKIRWFTTEAPDPIRIPDEWPGVTNGIVAMGRVANARRGVLAHTYFGHADGAWLVLYAWLRIKGGLLPALAYAEAKRRATGVQRVDVRDLLRKDGA